MNCRICKANTIGPETKPFGGFLCSNEHLQCYECNAKQKGSCLNCNAATKFLQMKFHSPRSSEAQLRIFSKKMSAELEAQSRLSEEHLSMRLSEESANPTARQTHGEQENAMALAECPASFFGGLDNHSLAPKCQTTEEHPTVKTADNSGAENEIIFEQPFNSTDLRFMDSTESFKNVVANSKDLEPGISSKELKCLSAEVLQDFDSQNVGFKNEVINNYLQTCSQNAFHTSPTYNCRNPDCHFGAEARKQKLESEMISISISTESDPSLKSTCLQTPEHNIVGQLSPEDYFIMQAANVTPAAQVANLISAKGKNVPIIDMRMQKIFQTLKEDIRLTEFSEKPYVSKMPTPIAAKTQEEKSTAITSCKKDDKNSDILDQLSNTYRAHYNITLPLVPPPNNSHILPKSRPAQQEPPSPQFERVPYSSSMAQELLLKQPHFSSIKSVPANLMHIPRSPILCPESTCQRMIFVSNFNRHLAVDHSHLPMERITPFQCKNFFLDARLFKSDASKCRLLYLMCDKITGLGSTEYKDFLPILVMTSRISLHQICDLANQDSSAPDYFLIWVTGIALEDLPISVSLAVWSRAGTAPSCHIVYSGQLYSIRNSQRALDVWQSGRTLLLSSQEIDALTSDRSEMLNIQLSVH